jgi:hypothetical protein
LRTPIIAGPFFFAGGHRRSGVAGVQTSRSRGRVALARKPLYECWNLSL